MRRGAQSLLRPIVDGFRRNVGSARPGDDAEHFVDAHLTEERRVDQGLEHRPLS